jgi:hypothetical protein
MDEATRQEVIRRAGGLCEYCHLPAAHVVTPFQIEHVIAKKHRGRDSLGNLAYACARCNLHKSSDLAGIDPETNKLTRLFNPRRHKWARHFRWQGAALVGRTAIGRTTVFVLAVNDPDRVRFRQELMDQGLFPV